MLRRMDLFHISVWMKSNSIKIDYHNESLTKNMSYLIHDLPEYFIYYYFISLLVPPDVKHKRIAEQPISKSIFYKFRPTCTDKLKLGNWFKGCIKVIFNWNVL